MSFYKGAAAAAAAAAALGWNNCLHTASVGPRACAGRGSRTRWDGNTLCSLSKREVVGLYARALRISAGGALFLGSDVGS